MTKTKIKWDSWSYIRKFFDSASIMQGEERQLSDEEIENINRRLCQIQQSINEISPLMQAAQERFKARHNKRQ